MKLCIIQALCLTLTSCKTTDSTHNKDIVKDTTRTTIIKNNSFFIQDTATKITPIFMGSYNDFAKSEVKLPAAASLHVAEIGKRVNKNKDSINVKYNTLNREFTICYIAGDDTATSTIIKNKETTKEHIETKEDISFEMYVIGAIILTVFYILFIRK